MEQPTPPSNDRPTSWRDVYTLVQDVEKRLADRLDDAVSSTRQVTTDHENRLRQVELASPVAQATATSVAANSIRITALEAANVIKQARTGGQTSIITYGQKVVVATVLVVNLAIAIVTFSARATP